MLKRNRGAALLTTLVLIMLLCALGVGILMLVYGHYRTSKQQIDRTQAYYFAEAGMWDAVWKLRTDSLPAATGSYELDVDGDGQNETSVTVEAQGLDGYRNISVTSTAD